MPVFTKRVLFFDLSASRYAEVEAVVDSGSTFSQIPQELADQLGLSQAGSRTLRLADGRAVEQPLANMLVALPGTGDLGATRAVIGGPSAAIILGAHALDALGVGVDTEGERLIPKVGYMPAETGWITV